MEQEYKMSVGYKIFYGLSAAAIAGFAIFILNKTLSDSSTTAGIIISIVFLALAGLLGLYAIKRRVIVSDEEIIVKGAFGTRQVFLNDVKGIRANSKAIFIHRIDGSKITINDYNAIGKSDDLIQWLKSSVRDLDNEDYEEEKVLILQNTDLGFTQEDREAKLKIKGWIALIYSGLALVLMVVTFFYHQRSPLLSAILVLLPLAGIIIIATNNGLIRLYSKRNSAYPSIFIGMLFACIASILQSFLDNKILDFTMVWTAVITSAVVLVAIFSLIILKQPNQTFKIEVLPVLLISAAFSFGSVMQVNRNLDESKPQVFSATVTDQYVKRGKSTSYHIVIAGWGTHQEEDDITVSSDFYDHVPVGSKVNVNLMQGKLHIPWYYITQ